MKEASIARRWVWRVVAMLIVQSSVLIAISLLFDSIRVDSLGAGIAAVLVIGFIDAILWPAIVRLALPLLVLTVGLASFALNGVVIWVADWLIDGFSVSTYWWGLLIAAALASVSCVAGSVLSLDDDDTFHRTMVRRALKDAHRLPGGTEPGFLFIQIDGLSHAILREAVAAGHMPTLRSLLDSGSHELYEWECDLSSQTGAMQAGILLGNNENMPAFRWYDKPSGRVLVSNNPSHAGELEQTQSSGTGLLADGGASRGNVFSGDASDALFTFSQLESRNRGSKRLLALFATPHGLFRIVGLFVADIVRELRSARVARRDGVEPRGHRGGIYPLLRAAVTVGLTEITTATLIGDIYRGVPSAYADFVGYDEVAHHSGIRRPESFDTLRRIDDRIRRLMLGFDPAHRPYHLIVLSDHGQTQGATFEQRYGQTLEALVQDHAEGSSILAPGVMTEGWGNLNGILTDTLQDETSFAARAMRRALRKHIVDGQVEVGPQAHVELSAVEREIIVLASGNLGLVSFAEFEQRASLEMIGIHYPGLITALAEHPGIGFVMVHSEAAGGGIAIGIDGLHELATGKVEGVDPLLSFGPNAARHLRRTDLFVNCPDLIVNSFYDATAEEGAAFEGLIGFHGGLGGLQAKPFILAPAEFHAPDVPIVGAEAVHRLFQGWMSKVSLSVTELAEHPG